MEALEVYECAAPLFGPYQRPLSNRVYVLLEDLGRHEDALKWAEQLEIPVPYLSEVTAIGAWVGRPDRLRRNELSRLALAFAAPDVSNGSRPVVEHDVEDPLAMAHRAVEEAVLGDTVVCAGDPWPVARTPARASAR